MSSDDDSVRYFHGTRTDFEVGQVIGHDSYVSIYTSTDPDDALGWAKSVNHFVGDDERPPRVYEVEPLDTPTPDPGWDDGKSFVIKNARIKRLVVIERRPGWPEWTAQIASSKESDAVQGP